jgi:hypothetical protein
MCGFDSPQIHHPETLGVVIEFKKVFSLRMLFERFLSFYLRYALCTMRFAILC